MACLSAIHGFWFNRRMNQLPMLNRWNIISQFVGLSWSASKTIKMRIFEHCSCFFVLCGCMRKVYAKYNWESFVFSGIDWAGLVKSDLSVDGLSHFTLTPSEHWAHTHTSPYTHTQGLPYYRQIRVRSTVEKSTLKVSRWKNNYTGKTNESRFNIRLRGGVSP